MGTSDQLFSAFLPIVDFYDGFSAEKRIFFILDESYIYLWIYEQIFRKQLVITLVQKR